MAIQAEIQVALRFKGEMAEVIAGLAKEDDRSNAYIVKKLLEERLQQLHVIKGKEA